MDIQTAEAVGGYYPWGDERDQKKKLWKEQITDKGDEETEKHFLKLVCRVNGIQYEEEKSREIAAEITVDKIKKTIDTVLKKQMTVTATLKR